MTESAAYSTSSMSALNSALGDLAAAYYERMANGDWARASVVLSTFADTYNANLASLLRFARERGANPALLPPQASNTYTPNTRRALIISLIMIGVPETVANQAPGMPAGITAFWRTISDRLENRTQHFIDEIASDAVRTLAQNLQSRIDARVGSGVATRVVESGGETFDRPAQTVSELLNASRQGTTRNPQQLPALRVGPSGWTMPTWGWWAIGIGVVAAGGVVAYGAVEKGWFK